MKAGARSDAIKIPNFCYLFSAVSYSERHIKITYCIYRARWFCHPEAERTHIYSIAHVTNTLIHRWKGLTVVVTSMYCFFFLFVFDVVSGDTLQMSLSISTHKTERDSAYVLVSTRQQDREGDRCFMHHRRYSECIDEWSGDGLAASLQPHVHAGDSKRVWAVT